MRKNKWVDPPIVEKKNWCLKLWSKHWVPVTPTGHKLILLSTRLNFLEHKTEFSNAQDWILLSARLNSFQPKTKFSWLQYWFLLCSRLSYLEHKTDLSYAQDWILLSPRWHYCTWNWSSCRALISASPSFLVAWVQRVHLYQCSDPDPHKERPPGSGSAWKDADLDWTFGLRKIK